MNWPGAGRGVGAEEEGETLKQVPCSVLSVEPDGGLNPLTWSDLSLKQESNT